MTDDPTADSALIATSISKTYGRSTVLKEIDLELKYGRIHALLGSNGSGKSTMVKFLTGVHIADAEEDQKP